MIGFVLGDVVSFWLGGTPIIGMSLLLIPPLCVIGKPHTCATLVLGSLKAATDILEKRGNIYSSRPRNIMGSVFDKTFPVIILFEKFICFVLIEGNFFRVACEELECLMAHDGGIGEL